MTKAELDALEADVEGARNRVALDLARLRAPETLSGFKRDLLGRAEQAKDALVHKATDAASSNGQRLLSEIKARIAANPMATLAIGAGLAWRLFRHPPVASILVGAGVASLLRTDGSQNGAGSEVFTRASHLASTVADKVQGWGEDASDLAGTMADKVQGWREDARHATDQAVSHLSSSTSLVRRQARQLTHAVAEHELRDTYLLGLAALAVGAATLISYQRRDGAEDARR
jgi:hypothetical protein